MIETSLWDVVEHLKTEEDMTAYLDAALEDGDIAVIVAALGDIARAKKMTQMVGAGFGGDEYKRSYSSPTSP